MSEGKNIVIVLYQYSVVVKGIERKLTEQGFHVDVLSENFDNIADYAMTADVFLLYLPADIMENKVKQREISDVCEVAKSFSKDAVLVGEKKYHNDLIDAVPVLAGFKWYDRPVDVALLAKDIEQGKLKPENTGANKRVLIVDDDPSYAGMVREWIRGSYRADVVTAGMQAITFLLKNKVDLILLDYEMPVVDGPQVLQMLRQEPATKDIPVVFLTGVGSKEEVARVLELKPNGYVLKSTTREELLHYIKSKI